MNPQKTSIIRGIISASVLGALTLLASVAQSANITWGTAQAISGDSDVSTNGLLIGAANVGNTGVPPTTVNGVTFQSFAAPLANGSSGIFTMTTASGGNADNTSGGSSSAPFNGLSPAYQTLLSSFVSSVFNTTLTISGLIIGMQYEFQVWSNRSGVDFSHRTELAAGNSVTLDSNPSEMNGGLGQWVIGTFTADAAMQTIDFGGDGELRGLVNGFQLRQLSPPVGVPETGSTLALFAAALGAIGVARRKLRARA